MRAIVSLLALSLLCACSGQSTKEDAMSGKARLHYPVTRQGEQVDHYFGQAVADPYRWLEDDRSPETEAWVKAQNRVTQGYLAQIPYRAAIKEKLASSWNYAKEGAPFREGRTTTSSRTTVCRTRTCCGASWRASRPRCSSIPIPSAPTAPRRWIS